MSRVPRPQDIEDFGRGPTKPAVGDPPANTSQRSHPARSRSRNVVLLGPHRSLPHRSTPAVAYTTRPKAGPGNDHPDTEFRVRHDRIHSGNVSLRVDGHMHHIGLGRTLDGTPVLLLVNGYDVRIIHATTGEIIRTLTIDPERRYHGTGKPPGGPTGPRKIKRSGP